MKTRIFGKETWIFRPKDYPASVWAMDIEKKTGHIVHDPVLKKFGIKKEQIRVLPLKLGEITLGVKAEEKGWLYWPRPPEVIKMKLGPRWDLPWYERQEKVYGPPKIKLPAIPGSARIKQLLHVTKFQERSANVRELQNLLKGAGYFPESVESTGYYGPVTEKAASAFQKSIGVKPIPKKALTPQQKAVISHFVGITKFGEKSERVKTLQRNLKATGFFPKDVPETGYYGPITEKAVSRYVLKLPAKESPYKYWKSKEGYEYQLVREKGTKAIYTVSRKTGRARLIESKPFEQAGFKLEQVSDVPKGFITRFELGPRWTIAKPPEVTSTEILEKLDRVGVSKKAKDTSTGWLGKVVEGIKWIGDQTIGRLKGTYPSNIAEVKINLDMPEDPVKRDEKLSELKKVYEHLAKKEYVRTPEFWRHMILEAQKREDAIMKGLKEDLGVEWDVENQRLSYTGNLKEALSNIEEEVGLIKEASREYYNLATSLEDLIKKYDANMASASKLESEIDKIDFEIDSEERKFVRDEDKLSSLYAKRSELYEKHLKLRPTVESQRSQIDAMSKKAETMRIGLEKKGEFLKPGGAVPLAWANLFAIQDEVGSRMEKLAYWTDYEKKAVYGLYSVAGINASQAAERFGITTKEFLAGVTPKQKKRRMEILKTQMDEIKKGAEEELSAWSITKKALTYLPSKAVKGLSKAVDKVCQIGAWWKGVYLEMTELLNYTQHIDTLIKALPTPEEWEKLSPEQRVRVLGTIQTVKIDEEILRAGNFSSEAYKRRVERGRSGEFLEVMEKLIKQQGGPFAKFAPFLAFICDMTVTLSLDPVMWLQGPILKAFGKVNLVMGKSLAKIDIALGESKGLSQLELWKKGETASQIIGRSLASVSGKSYNKIFPNYMPTIDQHLKGLFMRTWGKMDPRYKYITESYMGKTQDDLDRALRLQQETWGKMTKEEVKRLEFILRHSDEMPKTLREAEILKIMCPDMWTDDLYRIWKTDPKLGKILGAVPRKMFDKQLTKYSEFFTGLRKLTPYKSEQDIVRNLLAFEAYPRQYKSFLNTITKRYGKKVVDRFVKAEKEARTFYDEMYKLGAKAAKFEIVPEVKIIWPKKQLIRLDYSEADWIKNAFPDDAVGLYKTVKGSFFHKDPKRYLKVFKGKLPDPKANIETLFIRKKFNPSTYDRIETTLHETVHAWLKELQEIPNSQEHGAKMLTRLSRIFHANAEKPLRKKALEVIAKIDPQLDALEVMEEYYAYALTYKMVRQFGKPEMLARLKMMKKGKYAKELLDAFDKLYKNKMLIDTAESEFLVAGKILPERLKAIMAGPAKYRKETIQAYQGGLKFYPANVRIEAPYRKGYVAIEKAWAPEVTKELDHTTPGWLRARIKGGKAEDLFEGMWSVLHSRTKYLTVEKMNKMLLKQGYKDAPMVRTFMDHGIKEGFAYTNQYALELLKQGKPIQEVIKAATVERFRKIYFEALKKRFAAELPFLTGPQRKAFEAFMEALETGIKPPVRAVSNIRRYFGLSPTIVGPDSLEAYDLLINGKGRKWLPYCLKILVSGAWREAHPTISALEREIISVFGIPTQVWRWMVLFGRPAWYVRNYFDDNLRIVLGAEVNWKYFKMSLNPKRWDELYKLAVKQVPEAAGLKTTGFFFSERPSWQRGPISNYMGSLWRKVGGESKVSEAIFGPFKKSKEWLERVAEMSETARRQALFLSYLDNSASKAACLELDKLYAQKLIQKEAVLKLRTLIPSKNKKVLAYLDRIATRIPTAKLTTKESSYVLRMMKAYKMKELDRISKSFKYVEARLFDYSDLTEVERAIRTIFPFYGFWSKSFVMWTKDIAKDPRKLRAAQIYLRDVEQQTKDLPTWYKRRIKIGETWFILPIFSFHDTLDLWTDPVKHFTLWIKNPSHPIPGLGYDPVLSTWVEKMTGKKYWDDSERYEREGWTKEMRAMVGEEFVDWEKNKSFLSILANQFPIWGLAKNWMDVNNDMINHLDQLVTNKQLSQFTAFTFGFNVRTLTDLDKAWYEYLKLSPSEREKFRRSLPKEQEEALQRLIYINFVRKNLDYQKSGIKDPEYEEYLKAWPIKRIYYELRDTVSPEAAKRYLARNPEARKIMEKFWDQLDYTPERAAKEEAYWAGKTKAAYMLLRSKLKKKLTKPEEKVKQREYEHYGLGYRQDYTIEDLEKDVLDEKGNFRFWTLEEMEAAIPALKDKAWLKKAWDEIKNQITNFDAEWFREREKFKITKEKDYLWTIAMRTFGNLFIPEDTPATIEQRAKGSKNAYTFLYEQCPEWIRAEATRRYPAKQEYRDKHYEFLKHMWWMQEGERLENWFENFFDRKVTPQWWVDVFYARNPERKFFYPFKAEHSYKAKLDELNQEKGIFTNLAEEYLDTLSPGVIATWRKLDPDWWEYHDFWGTYRDYQDAGEYAKAINWFWDPINKKHQDAFFSKKEHKAEWPFWVKRKEYWNLPRNTWEDRHISNIWIHDNPGYVEWTHRFDVTEEQKEHSKIRDRLHQIGYLEKPTGTGREFMMSQAKLDAEKRMLYEQNDWLLEDFLRTMSKEARKDYEIQQGFFKIDPFDYEAKEKYLEEYPQLEEIWRRMAAPWERKMLDLQKEYFDLKTAEEKDKFLKNHPELQDYWETKALPWSYWFDKGKFSYDKKLVQDGSEVINEIAKTGEKVGLPPRVESAIKELKDEDQRWIANQLYQYAMKTWIKLGQEDRERGFKFFENLPEVIKNIYFKKHPEMRAYFAFCKTWHSKLQVDPEAGTTFFNSMLNRKWREMYFERHPEAEKFFAQLAEVNKMPRESWEDNRKVSKWWEEHDALQDWLRSKESEKDKVLRLEREAYFAILDRIPLVGSGLDYWTEVAKCRLEASRYLEEHPDLRTWLKEHAKIQNEVFEIQEQYFAIEDDLKRREFLKAHPELKDRWYRMAFPRMREMIDLQEAYFKIPQGNYEERERFLLTHPELAEYWEAMALPEEKYFEPAKFKVMKNSVETFKTYFQTLVKDTGEGEEYFQKLPWATRDAYINGKLDPWVKRAIYLDAMNSWHAVIETNDMRGIYFFKHLPKWIRQKYFLAHPEKQYLFRIPLEDFILEPLKQWEAEHPKLSWAYRILYQYEKFRFVPVELKPKVEEILIKAGVWEEREGWTRADWDAYWKERTRKSHELMKSDIERMPKLKEQIERLTKQYMIRPRPKPIFRRRVRFGWLVPFI